MEMLVYLIHLLGFMFMDLRLVSDSTSEQYGTHSRFYINGDFFSYAEEPPCHNHKIKGDTCIPGGTYKVIRAWSPKHQEDVPLIDGVPYFQGVEIHVGNTKQDTAGCILLGYGKSPKGVTQSTAAITDFYNLFFKAIDEDEAVLLTIDRSAIKPVEGK